MQTDEACALFFQHRGVPADFGIPTRAVIWTDRRDMIRGAVSHYHNGKAATLLTVVHGRWMVEFTDLAE